MRGVAILLLCLTPVVSWARGGGGCLAEGTLVLTPKGTVAIERLKRGDPVWSVRNGRLEEAEVRALMKVEPEGYLEISTIMGKLEVTPEHPVMVADGEYRVARILHAGDVVYLANSGKLDAAEVRSVQWVEAKRPAYNLLVSPGGTFIARGVVVHNKGCFLPDSQILMADGTESNDQCG